MELREEVVMLREALIRIKYLSSNTNISVAQDISKETLDRCEYRDPKTGLAGFSVQEKNESKGVSLS